MTVHKSVIVNSAVIFLDTIYKHSFVQEGTYTQSCKFKVASEKPILPEIFQHKCGIVRYRVFVCLS